MKRLLLVVVGCLMQLTLLNAQEVTKPSRTQLGLNYASELQTDFRRNVNWANMLRAYISVEIIKDKGRGGNLLLEAATISVARTYADGIINDLQGFSNIDADNIPILPAVLSFAWNTEYTSLQFGVRNINENYFTSKVASFFTHSSNGIFPTIAANFPIANYPTASLGVDFEWHIKGWSMNYSIYNGIGHSNWFGRENIFRFCPKSDGIFAALSLNNEASYGNSHLGAALHNDGQYTAFAVWAYTEFGITPSTSLIAQYSYAAGKEIFCQHYGGLGFRTIIGEAEIGALTNLAWFTDQYEWATEFSAKIPGSLFTRNERGKAILGHFAIQPALHIIRIGKQTTGAALFRFSIEI